MHLENANERRSVMNGAIKCSGRGVHDVIVWKIRLAMHVGKELRVPGTVQDLDVSGLGLDRKRPGSGQFVAGKFLPLAS
jgi:hypothetical protein